MEPSCKSDTVSQCQILLYNLLYVHTCTCILHTCTFILHTCACICHCVLKELQHTNSQLESSNKWQRSELSRVNEDRKKLQANINQMSEIFNPLTTTFNKPHPFVAIETNLSELNEERDRLKTEIEKAQSNIDVY